MAQRRIPRATPSQERVCCCSPGGTVSVQTPWGGRMFGRGSRLDPDESLPVPNEAALPLGAPRTYGEALGERYADLFVTPEAWAAIATADERASHDPGEVDLTVDEPDNPAEEN